MFLPYQTFIKRQQNLESVAIFGRLSMTTGAGRIAYVSIVEENNSEVFTINADGSDRQRLTNHSAIDEHPAISPDGTQIVFASNRDVTRNERELYIMNSDGSGLTRLTHDGGFNADPAWSPDGSKIAFTTIGEAGLNIAVMNADGTGLSQLTHDVNAVNHHPSWSPDGSQIAFASRRDAVRDGEMSIYTMNADGSDIVRLTSGSFDDSPCWILKPLTNVTPTADAGPDQTVTAADGISAQVTLDGSGSTGDIVNYVWTIDDVEIATGVNPTVTLEVGVHVITLTVTDSEEATDSDQVTITVE